MLGKQLIKKKIIRNAKRLGVKNIVIEDLKDIFVKDYVFVYDEPPPDRDRDVVCGQHFS